MTKKEAVELFVERNLNSIPTDWIQIVAEAKGEEIMAWPMWGTMWRVDDWVGEKLMTAAKPVEHCDKYGDDDHNPDLCDICVGYDEEMAGAYQIDGTAAYIYEIDGDYVIGVHGAGWDFYEGVWDALYDLLGYKWHDTAKTAK